MFTNWQFTIATATQTTQLDEYLAIGVDIKI